LLPRAEARDEKGEKHISRANAPFVLLSVMPALKCRAYQKADIFQQFLKPAATAIALKQSSYGDSDPSGSDDDCCRVNL
jgi:hypothetical protein